jgi:hypothetical protein
MKRPRHPATQTDNEPLILGAGKHTGARRPACRIRNKKPLMTFNVTVLSKQGRYGAVLHPVLPI